MKRIRKYQYAGNIIYPGLNTLDRSNNWMDVMAQQVMPTPQISSVLFPPQSWMSPIQKALANNYILNLGVTSKNNGISSIPATSSTEDIQDNNIGSALGNIFSQGVSSIGNTAFNNIMKGQSLTEGMAQDAASSVSGAAAGLTGNLIGKGINSLGGNSMLSRGIGQGIATGIGTIGGQALSNIINGKAAFGGISDSIKAIKGLDNASNMSKAAGISNLAGIGGQIVGAGLLAAFGPSKEYEGKYGGITQGMDTAYDLVQSAVGFIPGWGLVASGAMALNKGLSNIFGSTSGMTKQDAILGSAFMPAPVKWLNMAGAKTTQNFGNQSWQNTERTNAFMQNAFGNLSERFDRARQEAGKTYGTFSQGARRSADRNLAFANNAWEQILAMADLDELQRIRSLYMTSINNQRYAQMIQGGWSPIYRGKQGMKILNNATNHNMGMRLLSAAALIDNKQMILSALSGTKVMRPRMKPHRKGELPVYTEEELRQQAEWNAHLEKVRKLQAEELARKWKLREEATSKFNLQANLVQTAMNLQANETPFTGQEYQQAAENQRLEKVEKFHEAEKVGEAALIADLAVSAAPLLLRGFRWAFNKAGLLVKVPILTSENITENFLKFVGGSGKPVSLAIPKTLAQIEMYQMLELSGVDMSKIGIEDINKALELRLQLLFASNKRFSFLEPVTHNTELIRDIDNGLEVGYIGLRKPYLTNNKGFAEDTWILYSSNPRNKGLKIDMVENLSLTKPGFNKVYHGEQERLTNSAIQVGKQLGYEGVVSGESLLSPEKTVKMYPKYKHKKVLDLNGTYNWQNHNPGLPQQPGPVYMLEQPTYETVVKSKIFDPKIIDSKGKMKIDWRKGASMFTAWGVPVTLGGYIYANTQQSI